MGAGFWLGRTLDSMYVSVFMFDVTLGLYPVCRFLVIMSIFVLGFTLHVAAIYQPVRPMFTNGTDSGLGYPPNGNQTHRPPLANGNQTHRPTK